MSLANLLNLSCTITSRIIDEGTATLDAYGNPIAATSSTTTVCELQRRQQRPGAESTDKGDLAMDDWLLVLPAGTAIAAQDTVTIQGADYEVNGEPWVVRNPRTQTVSHVEAGLRRTTASGDVPEAS